MLVTCSQKRSRTVSRYKDGLVQGRRWLSSGSPQWTRVLSFGTLLYSTNKELTFWQLMHYIISFKHALDSFLWFWINSYNWSLQNVHDSPIQSSCIPLYWSKLYNWMPRKRIDTIPRKLGNVYICFNSITLILFLVILTQTMYVLRYSQLILCRYRDRDIGHRDREKVRMPKIATKNVS